MGVDSRPNVRNRLNTYTQYSRQDSAGNPGTSYVDQPKHGDFGRTWAIYQNTDLTVKSPARFAEGRQILSTERERERVQV